MISITNKGPFNDPDPEGWRDYEIKINNDIIATFRHIRSDGLFVCLEKASEAAAMNCHSMRNNKGGEMKKGFTLIELLVVISIIGVLAGLASFNFSKPERGLEMCNVRVT